jgi:hypothetical protein
MVRCHLNDYRLRILRAWNTKGVIPLPDPEPEHGAALRILPHPALFSPVSQSLVRLGYGYDVSYNYKYLVTSRIWWTQDGGAVTPDQRPEPDSDWLPECQSGSQSVRQSVPNKLLSTVTSAGDLVPVTAGSASPWLPVARPVAGISVTPYRVVS